MTSNNLVPVFSGQIQDKTIQLCNARDLHEFLDVGRFFSNWIKERIADYGFVEGEDYFLPKLANIQKGRGRPTTEYHITLDMAKELGMIERSPRGREIRRYFIACEKGIKAKPVPAPKQTRISSKTRTPEEMYYDALRVYTRGMKNVGALWIGMTELVFYRLDINDLKELTRESVQVAIQVVVDDLAGDRLGVEESLRYIRIPSAFN